MRGLLRMFARWRIPLASSKSTCVCVCVCVCIEISFGEVCYCVCECVCVCVSKRGREKRERERERERESMCTSRLVSARFATDFLSSSLKKITRFVKAKSTSSFNA
jgi:hypothetical protein